MNSIKVFFKLINVMKVIRHCKFEIFYFILLIYCFDRIGEKLWIAPGDDLAVSQLTNLWRSTLSRKGCFTLMRSGMFLFFFY